MAYSYTTADLISSIKSRAMIPTSQNTFTNTDILRFATEELQLGIVPLLMSVREEFYVYPIDQTVTASQSEYRIPVRASGMNLRSVCIVDSNNNELEIPIINPDNIQLNNYTAFQGFNSQFSAFVRNNSLFLNPVPAATGQTLRMYIHIRPGKLVETSAAAQITTVNSTSIVVSSIPTTMTTNTKIDFIKAEPGHDYLAIDKTITSTSGTTINLASVDSDVAVGDWVALSHESPIPQLPHDMQALLAQRSAVKILEALGDRNGMAAAKDRQNELEANVLKLVTPRIKGASKKIINRTRFWEMSRTW